MSNQINSSEFKEHMKHVAHCINQIKRFEAMYPDKFDSNERPLQFGFNRGRLTVLDRSNKHVGLLAVHTTESIIKVINRGFDPSNIDSMITFGFAMGYLQEELHQSHEIWWKSVVQLCIEGKWSEVMEYVQKLVREQCIKD